MIGTLLSKMSIRMTPDGARYLALAKGHNVPWPFNYRRLIPWLCRDKPKRWVASTVLGVVGMSVGTAFLAGTWEVGLAAGIMMFALPMNRFNLSAPVLVDAPAMLLAIAAAVVLPHSWPIAVTLVVLAGATKESAPVFAALYAWNLLLLVGLVVPIAVRLIARPGPDPIVDAEHAFVLGHPFRAGLKYHRGQWLDGGKMLVPWGGALVGLAALDWHLGALLAVAYAQLLFATDTVRLYQWAAPVLCVAACSVVPVSWLPVIVVSTIWNPWAGDGI